MHEIGSSAAPHLSPGFELRFYKEYIQCTIIFDDGVVDDGVDETLEALSVVRVSRRLQGEKSTNLRCSRKFASACTVRICIEAGREHSRPIRFGGRFGNSLKGYDAISVTAATNKVPTYRFTRQS